MVKAAFYSLLRRAVQGNLEKNLHTIASRQPAQLSQEFLSELLRYCQANNGYYRAFLAEKLITPAALAELPLLNKQIIRQHFSELQSRDTGLKTYLNSSGGSTGVPQTFVQDSEFLDWALASEAYYFREVHQIDPRCVRKVVLWGSERDTFKQRNLRGRLSNWLTSTVFLNTFQVAESDLVGYVERINEYRPHYVKGYSGSLYEISRVINKRKLSVHQPRFLYSSAETLRDFMRAEIEEAFGAKVYDFYGSREVGPIAGECRQGRKHIFTFNNHVEVVDERGKPLPEGRIGRILISNLHNRAMPLLRYDIGDTGSLGTERCPCGVDLPQFAELKGRITDHFKKPDGGLVHGEYFTHLFYFRPWVSEFQVNQLARDLVQICIVKAAEPPPTDLLDIEQKIRLVMGENCRIAWEYVAQIPRTPQGKHLFTRSLVE
jgi:phenylacetate-CoA ligase